MPIDGYLRSSGQPVSDGLGQLGENMAMTQSGTTAELQRTIAELRRERDAALARRNAEYSERTEHQAATIDVLRAMSASPSDPQPVFNLIVHHARELCGGFAAGLLEYRRTAGPLSLSFRRYHKRGGCRILGVVPDDTSQRVHPLLSHTRTESYPHTGHGR